MPNPQAKQQASVTLVALCFTAILAMALTSYVVLCQRSYDFSTRQMYDDKVRQLAQTGLEEALWALNQNDWSNSGPSSNLSWSGGTTRTLTISYASLAPGATGQLVLTVTNSTSSGPVWPTITSAATITLASGRTVTKTMQATTRPAPLFGNAIASANSYVSFMSGGTVDSWNSDPGGTGSYVNAYSFTSGNAPNYAAVVAGNTDGSTPVAPGLPNGVLVNQALIRGYTATFGNSVSASTSSTPKGKVQGPASVDDVDGTRLGRSAFVPVSPVFDVTVPSAPPANTIGLLSSLGLLLGKLLGVMPSGTEIYKFNGDLNINGAPLALGGLAAPNMVIEHPVTIVIDGDFSLSTLLLFRGNITVKPTGSLQLIVTGDVTIAADGIDNQTNDPRKVAIFCTSTSTTNSLQYNTTDPFCGVIYCENKPIEIRQNATFHGALLSRQYVRFNNSATNPVFHYDTALRKVRFDHVTTPYLIDQLTEL